MHKEKKISNEIKREILVFLRNNPNIVILIADKGAITVVIEKTKNIYS